MDVCYNKQTFWYGYQKIADRDKFFKKETMSELEGSVLWSIQGHWDQGELFRKELKERNDEFRDLRHFNTEKRIVRDEIERWLRKQEAARARTRRKAAC